ncbi:hypothetical protein QR97_01755 [Streptomyces sp. PBH53]|uniref:hypothetical protein n=1 Tax=Streptomyces sp. PBH53 TaxID=1577075 RepID=UPI00065548D5|nr:hypothetical protein [Streptomyces sp. PBH53]AKN68697.1 hypothetical protein QR97_01755 [Streptomyces sp. PBH53]
MAVSLVKPTRPFTVVHKYGEVLYVVQTRPMLTIVGRDPYDWLWAEIVSRSLSFTEVEAVDRWSARLAASDEIGPRITERDWLLGRIDLFARNNHSANPQLPIRERTLVIDVVLESDFAPMVDPTGPPIAWDTATVEERRAWLGQQPTGVLLRWYRHVRHIRQSGHSYFG